MWIGVLGSLLVRHENRVMELPAARQRAVLAVLLVYANRVVPADELADIVWDGSPPPGARVTTRGYVLRLRLALGSAVGPRIATRPHGYEAQFRPAELDLLRFAELCSDGGAALRAGSWRQSWEALGEALGLWRDRPLCDVPCQRLQREEVPRLEEMRLQAAEWRAEAGLRLGHHDLLVGELQALAAQQPLRERFHAQLMTALTRCGRQAEALAAYQQARGALVDELGVEPGPELRRLQQQILRNPDLVGASPPPGTGRAVIAPEPQAAPVPRQLPGAVTHFAGREPALAELTRMLDQKEQAPGAAAIIVIAGTPGVGKTALAVRWAHQVASRFPEGQLYANLRGYDPGQPMAPSDALAGLLSALGVRGDDIPADADERAARYRSALAGRRMLVVLDNARSVDQVRPLLPGTETCMTVLTSRDSLAGLVARDGAVRLDLDVLPLGDAITLLRMLIGGRVLGEPGPAAKLAVQCSRLPLTLRVAAELAAAHPAAPLADLVSELSDRQRRLDRLDAGGDPRSSARTVFSWSCQHLDASAARAFRLASVHPGPDIDRYALAALTATTAEQSRHMLKALQQAHLIQPTRPGRYSMHDLLRAYASELAARKETPDQRQAAVTRLFDYYLHTAAAATDTLMPAERRRRPRLPPPTTAPHPPRGPSASQKWLDAERANLVAVVWQAAAGGWPGHATSLSATLSRYLETGGHAPEALIIHGHASDAALRTGDIAAAAAALTSLAMVDWRQGRFRQAAARLRHALALSSRADDQTGAARALANLGMIDGQQGKYQDAASHLRQALALFREVGDQTGAARALLNLGMIDDQQGRYQGAADHYQRALALFREAGDRSGEAYALGNLGITCRRQGRYQRAASHFRHAMAVYGETGSRSGRAQLSAAMGDLDLQQGRPDAASDHFQRALDLCRETGDQSGEATALNGLGEATLCTGKPEHARAHHCAALDLASQIGEKYQQARAHDGLARCHHATGDRGDAQYHWQQALVLYEELGAPEADRVREELASCPAGGRDAAQVVPPGRG